MVCTVGSRRFNGCAELVEISMEGLRVLFLPPWAWSSTGGGEGEFIASIDSSFAFKCPVDTNNVDERRESDAIRPACDGQFLSAGSGSPSSCTAGRVESGPRTMVSGLSGPELTGGEDKGEVRLLVSEEEGVVGAVDTGEGMAIGALVMSPWAVSRMTSRMQPSWYLTRRGSILLYAERSKEIVL